MNRPHFRPMALAATLLLSGCGLLLQFPDTSGIRYCPEHHNQVLAEDDDPHIRFDFQVDRESVEAIFTIRDCSAVVSGSYRWQGENVTFVAEPELVAGRRYVCSFSGTFRDLSGIKYEVNRLVPFYYLSREEAPPYVVSSSPASGETIDSGRELRIRFSESIDPLSLARAFSLQPDTAQVQSWEDETRLLVVTPKNVWEQRCIYTLRLNQELRDTAGVPLSQPWHMVFLVQEDITPPRIEAVRPAFNRPQQLFPETGSALEDGVGIQEALRISFSEDMDRAATEAAFSLVPAVVGTLAWLDGSTLVFAPDSAYLAGQEYCLSFSSRAADLSGNRLDGVFTFPFNAAAAGIEVTTELLHDGLVIAPGAYTTAVALEIELYAITTVYDYNLLFAFTGAVFDSNSEKMAVQDAISLSCLFPVEEFSEPKAIGFSWSGDTRLSVTWTDLQPSTSSRRVYYLLRIRGGLAGVASQEGSLLQGDLEQLLVTKVE